MRRRAVVFPLFVCLFLLLGAVKARAVEIHVRVGVNVNLPPYQFVNSDEGIDGLHIDVMNALAEECGLVVEYFPFSNTYEAVLALEKKEIDAVLGVPAGKYNSYPILTSEAINTATLCLVTDTAHLNSEIAGGTRIVLESDTVDDYTHMVELRYSYLLMKDTQLSALNALQRGYADMLIGVKDSVIWQLRERGLEEDYSIIRNFVGNVDYLIAVPRADTYLLGLLDRGLTQLRFDGRYEELYRAWGLVEDNSITLQRFRQILYVTLAAGAVVCVYLIFNLRMKRILQQQVEKRTKDLNRANETVRQMNEELQQKIVQHETYNRLLATIVEASPAATLLLDSGGQVLHRNQYAAKLMVTLESGTLHWHGKEYSLRELLTLLQKPTAPVRAGGQLSFSHGSDDPRRLKFSTQKLYEEGEYSHFLFTMEDITAETLEQDAEFEKRKNEALNRMVASIAHEIKNPLTTISAAIGMVRSKRNDEKFIDTFHQVVPGEVERINRLVQNLVNYARPSDSASAALELGGLCRSVLHLTESLAAKNAVKLVPETEEGIFIEASRDKIQQVLLNLLLNALESIDARLDNEDEGYEPKIILRCRRRDGFAAITLWDNGVGMDEALRKACLQPFYSTKSAGTGLGLPVSAKYIGDIGGTLNIESQPGEFTSITILLPEKTDTFLREEKTEDEDEA